MKIALDYGHNCSPDTGANGYKFEDDLIRQVGSYLIPLLQNMGHEIVLTCPKKIYSVNDSLQQRCNKANSADADIFVSLHFNSFSVPSARGTEVWVTSTDSKLYDEAKAIASNIAKLGYVNRGVKCGNFKVLRDTNMPAMLIEGCFVSSKSDIENFNAEKMANAIAQGLHGKLATPVVQVTPTKEKGTLTVLVDTLLKPSTEQSEDLPRTQCKPIPKGEYSFTFLGDEEGHFLVKFDEKDHDKFGDNEWYVYHEHVKF